MSALNHYQNRCVTLLRLAWLRVEEHVNINALKLVSTMERCKDQREINSGAEECAHASTTRFLSRVP